MDVMFERVAGLDHLCRFTLWEMGFRLVDSTAPQLKVLERDLRFRQKRMA